jgi:hypothetical protein
VKQADLAGTIQNDILSKKKKSKKAKKNNFFFKTEVII